MGWAIAQNFLGMALARHADRTEGQAGMALLAEAATAHRAALEVYDEAEDPEMRAYARFNLGRALSELGERTEGDAGAALLAEAVSAYRAALDFYQAADPPSWAMTQINLGKALADQAGRTGGPEAAGLLAEAEAAYRAALEVYTRDLHPEDWALAQNNLGLTLADQAGQTEGEAAEALLGERSPRFVRRWRCVPGRSNRSSGPRPSTASATRSSAWRAGRSRRPRRRCSTRRWRRIAGRSRSRAGRSIRRDGRCRRTTSATSCSTRPGWPRGAKGPRLLAEAAAACRAVLEVRTREVDPEGWAMAQENLAAVLEAMGDLGDGRLRGRYAEALACLDGALEVLAAGDVKPKWARCARNRARVAGKLAAERRRRNHEHNRGASASGAGRAYVTG